MRISRGLLVLPVLGAVGACSLITDLGPLTAGGASDSGAESGVTDSGADASPDAAISSAVVLAEAGNVQAATGDAQQTHIIWAVGAKLWWLFYIDGDANHLKTRSSPDFVTWTDGASLSLPYTNAGEGRNFSVAYAQLGGDDVVHISLSHDGGSIQHHTHARAVIQGSAITFDTPADVCSFSDSSQGPDSPATIVLSDGTIWDSTGDVASAGTGGGGHYNEDAFVSSSQDTGSNWTNSFTQDTVEIVMVSCNARQLISAGGLFAAWEAGDQEPNPTSVHASVFAGSPGSWGSPVTLFPSSPQDPNDWDGVSLRVGGSPELHVIRARASGGYDHVVGIAATKAAAPAALTRTAGSGVLLLADPDHLAAVDTAQDGTLEIAKWSEGPGTWSAWTALTGSGARHYLSGFCPDLTAHPEAGGCAVLWTQPTNSAFQIAGLLVRPAP